MQRPRFMEDTSVSVLAIAKRMFDAVVGDDPARALTLDPVLRWTERDWSAHAAVMQQIGFDPENPVHLVALQATIDQACENQAKDEKARRARRP